MISGMNVRTSPYLTESKEVPRTWKERWWSWPWRPWIRTKVIQVASTQFLIAGNLVLCHPEMWRQAKDALEGQYDYRGR